MFDFEYRLPEERNEKGINSSTVENSSSDENGTNSSAVESISHIEQPSGNLPPDGKKFKSFYAEQSKNKEPWWSVKSEIFANNQELVNNQEIYRKVSSQFETIELDSKQGINATKLNNRPNTKTKKFRAIINIQKSNSDSYESWTNNAEKSLEIALLNNPRLPGFLAGISDVYEKKTPERRKWLNKVIDDIYKEKWIIRDESDVEENGRVPLFSEYLLKYDTQENFDAYLADEEFRNGFLLEYISNHTNKATGEIFYSAIDATTQAWLAWRTHLYHKYKQEYPTWGNDKLDKIKNSASTLNNVKNHIDRIVVDSICNWSNLKEWLDELFNVQKELAWRMTDLQKAALEEYNIPRLLRESIKIYFSMSENINVNHPLQKTGDNVFDLKLRSYLYLYAQQYSKFENKWWTLEDYEEELNKVLIAILVKDWKIDNAWYNEYLEEENALNNRMVQAQREARNRAIEWNRSVNSNIASWSQKESDAKFDKEWTRNFQEATWSEIAQEKNLSQDLSKFEIKREPSETEKTFINKIAFRRTCKEFILNNNDVKDFVSIWTLQKFFIVWENGASFNQRVRDSFKLQWINKNGSNDLMKLNEIEAMLKGVFPVSFNKIKEGTIDLASNWMEKVDKIVKNHAIWAVIDNVRDVLDGLSKKLNSWQNFESFKYNEDNPVEIKGDKMIISGFFGWNDIIVYYNTINWDLSITSNSNISEDGNEQMTVWKKSLTKKIGTIETFDNILQDFYKTPTDEIWDSFSKLSQNNSVNNTGVQNSETNFNQLSSRKLPVKKIMETNRLRLQKICWTQIDKIWSMIEYELEREALVSWVVSSLFRTLNIFSDNTNNDGKTNEEKTLNLKGNTIYQFIKMIQNSDNKTLYKFQEEMPRFMNCFWLSWWTNNHQQNKEKNLYTIFNSTLDWEKIENWAETKLMYIWYLRQISDNFKNECENIKKAAGSGIIGEDYNSWILKILIDNFSSTNNTLKSVDADSIKEFSVGLRKKIDSLNKYEKDKHQKELKDKYDIGKKEKELFEAYE